MKRNLFITFEGLDGSGKTTQVELLKDLLEKGGEKVKLLREPGGTEISEKIRDILLDNKNSGMTKETELLLYLASRAQLVEEEIKKSLEDGYYVICDRFIDSTSAYQGYGRGFDVDLIERFNSFVLQNNTYQPDITFLLEISHEILNDRILSRAIEKNRLENENLEFFKKVAFGYKELAMKNSDRIVAIDGTMSIEEIHNIILSKIKEKRSSL